MRFDDAFAAAEAVPGWLTRAQALVLWREAHRLAPGTRVVEIGSHLGRSTLVLAAAAPGRVTAVDPFLPGWRYGETDTRARFEAHLEAAGLRDRVDVVVSRSQDARADWHEPVDLVYVDGKHDYWTVADDLRWAAHLPPGGRLLVHDSFSSLGVTLALLRHALPARHLRYLDRTGSLARFEVAPVRLADRARMLGALPWFARNLVLKVLLRLRLRRVAAAWGHHDSADPY